MITKTGTMFIKEAARNTAGLQALENRLVQFQNNPDALDNEPEMEISLGTLPGSTINGIRKMYGLPEDFSGDGTWYVNNNSVKHIINEHISPRRRRRKTVMTPQEAVYYAGSLVDAGDNKDLDYNFEYSEDKNTPGKTRRDFLAWNGNFKLPPTTEVSYAAVRNPETGKLRIHSLYHRSLDNIENKFKNPAYTLPENPIFVDPD